jgi:Helix-turn-helix domain
MTEELLKARDVARMLDVSMATVVDYCQSGDLPYIQLRGRHGAPYRFRRSEIEATLEEWRTLSGDNLKSPATRKRPGPDTGKRGSDALRILRPDG